METQPPSGPEGTGPAVESVGGVEWFYNCRKKSRESNSFVCAVYMDDIEDMQYQLHHLNLE